MSPADTRIADPHVLHMLALLYVHMHCPFHVDIMSVLTN